MTTVPVLVPSDLHEAHDGPDRATQPHQDDHERWIAVLLGHCPLEDARGQREVEGGRRDGQENHGEKHESRVAPMGAQAWSVIGSRPVQVVSKVPSAPGCHAGGVVPVAGRGSVSVSPVRGRGGRRPGGRKSRRGSSAVRVVARDGIGPMARSRSWTSAIVARARRRCPSALPAPGRESVGAPEGDFPQAAHRPRMGDGRGTRGYRRRSSARRTPRPLGLRRGRPVTTEVATGPDPP